MVRNRITLHPYAGRHRAAWEFLAECRRLDPEIRAISFEAWCGFVNLESNAGGRDFAFALEGERVVGLLMSRRRDRGGERIRHVRIIVHPRFRRRGIASRLLDRACGQDARPGVSLQAWCPGSWTAMRGFLVARGFAQVSEELEMERGAAAPLAVSEPAPLPLRDDRLDSQIARLHNQAYESHFGFTPIDAAEIAATRAMPGAAYLVVTRGGALRGYVHYEAIPEEPPSIESLVVAAAERRRGLGRRLLRSAIDAALSASGAGSVTLRVRASNAAAIALYTQEGFAATGTNLGFFRPYRAPAPGRAP